LFAGKLTLIQSRAEAAAAAEAAQAAQTKQKREARHHNPSPHLIDRSKQKKERNPKTDEELESTRCRRYSERKRHLSQTPEAKTKRPRSSSGRSTEKETLSTAKIVADSISVTHLDASKYLPRKGPRTTPTSVVCTIAVPASPVTCPSAVHPSPVTCLTAVPLSHPTAVPLSHPTAVPLSHPTAVPLSHPKAVPLSHPTAVPPSSATVTTAVHPPSVTCTSAVRSTVRQAVVESRSPSKATRSQLCPDSSKDADRLPFKSPAKTTDPPSLQRKRPCSGGDNSAKENETPVVFDLRSKLRHGSGNRNDPTPRSYSARAKSDLRQVSDSELTHTPLVHRVEKSVHLRLGRPSLACDDAEKETRQKKSPEKCNVPKTFEVPHVPDVLTKNSIQNMLDENRTSHSRKDDQKSTSSLSASVPVLLPLPSAAPAEDLEEGEITDEDVESDEQQLTTLSGTGSDSSRGRELNSNGPELQSQKLPDTNLASDSLVKKSEDVSKRCSKESLSELEPVTQASRKEPKLLMKEKSADENIVKKSGKHLKEGISREEEAAKGNTNRGRERIELELKLDVRGCGQQEPRVLLKRLDMKELQQFQRLQPEKEQTPPIEELSKESKKAEKEKREQEVQKSLLDKLEKQRMLQVQRRQLVEESGEEEKEKLGTSREQVLQEEKCRQESQERLLKKDKNRKQEVVAEKTDKKSEQVAQEMRLNKSGHKSRQELEKAPLEKNDKKCSQVEQEFLHEKQKMMSKVLEKDGEMCGRRQEQKQSKPYEKTQQNKEKYEKDRRRSSSHQKQQREKEEGQDGELNNSQKNQVVVLTEKGNVQIKKPENNVSQGMQNQLDKKKAGDCLQESKDAERGKEESPRVENRVRKHQTESFLSKENAADSLKGKLLPSEKAGLEAKSRRQSGKRQDRDSKDVTRGAVTVLPSKHAARPVRSMKDFCDQLVETLFPGQGNEKGREVCDVGDGAARSEKLNEKHAVGAESVPSLDNKADKSNSELNASRTHVAVETNRDIAKDTREDLRAVKASVKALEKDKKDAGKDEELAKAAESKKKSSNTPEANRKAFKTAEKAVIVEKKTANAVMEEKVTSKPGDMNERADKTAEKNKRLLLSKTAEERIRTKKAIEVVMGDSKSEKAVELNMGIHTISEKDEVIKTATEDASKALPQDETGAQTVGLDTKVAKTMQEDKRPSKPAEVEKEAAKGDRKAAGSAEVGSKIGRALGKSKDATRAMEVGKKAADREISADSSITHAKKLMPVRERGVDDEGRKTPAKKQNIKTGDTTFDESEDPSIPVLIDERVDERIASASASGKRAINKRSSGDLEQLKGMKYWFKEILNAQNQLKLS
jgi:hypothetical protein